MDKLIIPPYLHEGDKVVILSPSGKIDKSFLKGAVKRLASWGLQPVLSRHAGSSNGVYAGTVSQRLEDLQEAMDDPSATLPPCTTCGRRKASLRCMRPWHAISP